MTTPDTISPEPEKPTVPDDDAPEGDDDGTPAPDDGEPAPDGDDASAAG